LPERAKSGRGSNDGIDVNDSLTKKKKKKRKREGDGFMGVEERGY